MHHAYPSCPVIYCVNSETGEGCEIPYTPNSVLRDIIFLPSTILPRTVRPHHARVSALLKPMRVNSHSAPTFRAPGCARTNPLPSSPLSPGCTIYFTPSPAPDPRPLGFNPTGHPFLPRAIPNPTPPSHGRRTSHSTFTRVPDYKV